MATFTERIRTDWQDTASVVLGLWLIVSPWILGYATELRPMANVVIVGAIIALIAAVALYAFRRWEEWINIALAVWLVASPWILGFGNRQTAVANQIIVGLLVAILAFWAATVEHSPDNLAPRH
jgi:SPW repeat